MLICFTSDLHGRQTLYEQLTALLRTHRPGLVILGGDMVPDGDIDDPVGTQTAYVESTLIPCIENWRSFLPELKVACILGNHDWLCTHAALRRRHDAGTLVLLDHRTPWRMNGTAFLGYSHTPPTPYWVKDFERLDLPNDPIPETGGAVWDAGQQCVRQATPREHFLAPEAISNQLAEACPPKEPWIFVCHAPPHDCKLDWLPHIDFPVGSRAVRQFIERHRPQCALHGHIHESPVVTGHYADRIGDSLCINPGQDRERVHAVLFDSSDPAGTLRHTVFP